MISTLTKAYMSVQGVEPHCTNPVQSLTLDVAGQPSSRDFLVQLGARYISLFLFLYDQDLLVLTFKINSEHNMVLRQNILDRKAPTKSMKRLHFNIFRFSNEYLNSYELFKYDVVLVY